MLQTTSHSSIVDLSNPHRHSSATAATVILRADNCKNDFQNFKEGLYRNSKIYRIILGEHIRYSKLALNKWHIMNLKLVTEFGLPPQGMLPYNQMEELPITCQILQLQHSRKDGSSAAKRFITSSTLKIECRLYVEKDQWKITYEKPQEADDHILIQYRITSVPNSYLICQEIWDNGTPGKLWDSALVMINLFNIMFQLDKTFLSGKRILDLSAGTGTMGLSIAQNCRLYNTTNPPEIVMTDLEDALPLINSNKTLNCITRNVHVKKLKWGSGSDIHRIIGDRPFDYIFISDVLYNTMDFPALVATFRQLVYCSSRSNKETVIIMGYKPRGLKKNEEDLFFNDCRMYMNITKMTVSTFASELTPRNSNHPFFEQTSILDDTGVCLYQFTKKKSPSICK
ncbi:putative methyltransferase-domain-containing protein [Mycotypha africana]|uniref:putative methyltransferase-domain-containing protein n=1 Tax=Mycotypha africana TaxID=64632 RepID=UPI0023000393|nr:putative methyltransferase-domain-containing protein [Mycotypha africana]KAI8987643.1 putative methyltransferase-domain-containing protein [Mycotypha africana]